MIGSLTLRRYWRPFVMSMTMAVVAVLVLLGGDTRGVIPTVDVGLRLPATTFIAMALVSIYGLLCAAMIAKPEPSPPISETSATDKPTWSARCLLGGAMAMSFAVLAAFLSIRGNEDAIRADLSLDFPEIVVGYALVLLGIEAFAWGMFWAMLCRGPLVAITLTALSLCIAWFIALFPTAPFVAGLVEVLAVRAALASAALFGSRWLSAIETTTDLSLCQSSRRALFWKEARQQRAAWLAFAALAVVVVFAVNRVVRPIDPDTPGLPPSVIIGVTAYTVAAVYGLLCAGSALAGERESGTLGFLDACARTRTEVWTVKCTIGAAYTSAQAGLVGVLLLLTGFSGGHAQMPKGVYEVSVILSIVCVSLETFAWGMLASSILRTSLGAIVLGALPPLVIGMAGIRRDLSWPVITKALLVQSIPAAAALFLSCGWFNRKYAEDEPSHDFRTAATSDPAIAQAAFLFPFRMAALSWSIFGAALFIVIMLPSQTLSGNRELWCAQMVLLGEVATVAAAVVLVRSIVACVRGIAGISFREVLIAHGRAALAALNVAAVLYCVRSYGSHDIHDFLGVNLMVLAVPAASILVAAWWSVSCDSNGRKFPVAAAAIWILLLEFGLLAYPTATDPNDRYALSPADGLRREATLNAAGHH